MSLKLTRKIKAGETGLNPSDFVVMKDFLFEGVLLWNKTDPMGGTTQGILVN